MSTFGAMTLTNQQAAAGDLPEGVDGVTVADLYGQYRGRLRRAVAVYGVKNHQLVPVLLPVINTELWTVLKLNRPAAGICSKFLPDLRQPTRLPVLELIDEAGYLLRCNAGAVIRRACMYVYNSSSYPYRYRLGIGGTGITSVQSVNPYRSRRGVRRDSASYNTESVTATSGDLSAWIPSRSYTRQAPDGMYEDFSLVCNNGSATLLVIDSEHPLSLVDSGGHYIYASDSAGATPIKTLADYVKFWLLESVYPYAGS